MFRLKTFYCSNCPQGNLATFKVVRASGGISLMCEDHALSAYSASPPPKYVQLLRR